MAPATAREHGLETGQIVELSIGGRGGDPRLDPAGAPGGDDHRQPRPRPVGGRRDRRRAGNERLPAPRHWRAVDAHRSRDPADRRAGRRHQHPAPPRDGGAAPGPPRDAARLPRQSRRHTRGAPGPAGGVALHRVAVSRPRLGHGHRPDGLHRLQRLRRRLPGREQYPHRRPRRMRARPRDALAAGRPLLLGPGGQAAHLLSARPVHALREGAVRAGLPRQRHRPHRRGAERAGLQPLHRHPLLLAELPLQGAAVQLPLLPAVRRRRGGRDRAGDEPRHQRPLARCDGGVHLLRAAHPAGADRGRRRAAAGPRRRGRHPSSGGSGSAMPER